MIINIRSGSLIYEAKIQTPLMRFLVALGLVGIISTKGITGLDVILIIGLLLFRASTTNFKFMKGL